MAYWLLKSEPFKYPWQQLLQDKKTHWDGVRNFQAAANMRAMKIGDKAFFYHSNEGKEIVGIAEIIRTFYPDPAADNDKFGLIDIAPLKSLKNPVTLQMIKSHPVLCNMALVKQSRLSVCPVSPEEWSIIEEISK